MGGKKKTVKKKKAKKDNWFEKLTAEQLKQLCSASQMAVSGVKAALVQRLLDNEHSQEYAHEAARVSWKAYANCSYDSCDEGPLFRDRPDGPGASQIKEEARAAGLTVSGTRFDLVLRLLQHKNGVGQPKRAAGQVSADGVFQPKKRAKSSKLPDPDQLFERVAKKCDFNWRKASDWQYKQHASDVFGLINKLVVAEVEEKSLVAQGKLELAWEVCEAVIQPVLPDKEQGHKSPLEGWGYCGMELSFLGEHLRRLAEATVQVSDAVTLSNLPGHVLWMDELISEASSYGHDVAASWSKDLKDLVEAATLLRAPGAPPPAWASKLKLAPQASISNLTSPGRTTQNAIGDGLGGGFLSCPPTVAKAKQHPAADQKQNGLGVQNAGSSSTLGELCFPAPSQCLQPAMAPQGLFCPSTGAPPPYPGNPADHHAGPPPAYPGHSQQQTAPLAPFRRNPDQGYMF